MMRFRVRAAGVLFLLCLLCLATCSPGLTPDELKYVQSRHEPGLGGFVKTLLSRLLLLLLFPQQQARPGFPGAHVDCLVRGLQPRRQDHRLGERRQGHHHLEHGHGRSPAHPARPTRKRSCGLPSAPTARPLPPAGKTSSSTCGTQRRENLRERSPGTTAGWFSLAFSPDGKRLASAKQRPPRHRLGSGEAAYRKGPRGAQRRCRRRGVQPRRASVLPREATTSPS